MRNTSINCLLVNGKISEPVGKERIGIHIERRRPSEDLSISGPTHPFVPLRTVGRNAHEVALHTPLDITLKLIQIGI